MFFIPRTRKTPFRRFRVDSLPHTSNNNRKEHSTTHQAAKKKKISRYCTAYRGTRLQLGDDGVPSQDVKCACFPTIHNKEGFKHSAVNKKRARVVTEWVRDNDPESINQLAVASSMTTSSC
jgi:hypothetical protein